MGHKRRVLVADQQSEKLSEVTSKIQEVENSKKRIERQHACRFQISNIWPMQVDFQNFVSNWVFYQYSLWPVKVFPFLFLSKPICYDPFYTPSICIILSKSTNFQDLPKTFWSFKNYKYNSYRRCAILKFEMSLSVKSRPHFVSHIFECKKQATCFLSM